MMNFRDKFTSFQHFAANLQPRRSHAQCHGNLLPRYVDPLEHMEISCLSKSVDICVASLPSKNSVPHRGPNQQIQANREVYGTASLMTAAHVVSFWFARCRHNTIRVKTIILWQSSLDKATFDRAPCKEDSTWPYV